MRTGLRLAVVGSGISGLSAAWLLSKGHHVTLFERDDRAGGHSNTVNAAVAGRSVAVDTGFIVYNTASYPNLIALFAHLGVETAATDMGFAVSLDSGGYEYSGAGLAGLFGQTSNLFRPSHWRMIADMMRFFREAPALLATDDNSGMSLGGYLTANGYSQAFIMRHILPMAAAIWSTPAADVLAFPAAAFVRFFANHGLLQVNDRPQWRTVVGGSHAYVIRMLADMSGRVALGQSVQTIVRGPAGVSIRHEGGCEGFDGCVVATHADDALGLLADADADERQLLGAFRYEANRAVLHRDTAFMPRRRRLWESWNYLGSKAGADADLSVTYWMNKLQPLGDAPDLFVTLNPARQPAPGAVIATFDYMHPLLNQAAMQAQTKLWELQGRRCTWFCGSYFGYGFHEDGLQSGLAAAEDVGGVRRPWTVTNESGRIHIGARRSLPAMAGVAAE